MIDPTANKRTRTLVLLLGGMWLTHAALTLVLGLALGVLALALASPEFRDALGPNQDLEPLLRGLASFCSWWWAFLVVAVVSAILGVAFLVRWPWAYGGLRLWTGVHVLLVPLTAWAGGLNLGVPGLAGVVLGGVNLACFLAMETFLVFLLVAMGRPAWRAAYRPAA